MLDLNCPGSKSLKQPIPEVFICPNCGEEVEIWTHERMRKCGSCGTTVLREIDEAWCAQWCRYAKECIGIEKYEEMIKAGLINKDENEEICIPEQLKNFMREVGVPIPGENNGNDRRDTE